MKHLRLYENFQTEQEIEDICKKYNIKNWSINSEGLVDVDGGVNLHRKYLYKLPLKFGKVTGCFICSFNNLTNLEGVPKYVGGNFTCSYNQLASLEGSPKKINGYFGCKNNQLINLEGSPKEVVGNFYCNNNKLVSFEGAPDFVGGNFYCSDNPIYNIWNLFRDYNKVELFNYYDIVRELDGKPAIVLDRLNQFLEDIGKPPVKNFTEYITI